ncbi:MAG: NPCBM/NEW2 domain-containing protein [Pirellulaceae bacterium]|nr:NPCBM/NEW2 domain-containing protein [Pirellulaceae bacterium]
MPARIPWIPGLFFLLLAVPLVSAEPAERLLKVDPDWTLHLQSGGETRAVAAADLGTWGEWREVESGPQILLTDGSLIRADVLKLDDKSLVVGDATGLGRGLWDESTLPRAAVRAILHQPPAAALARDKLLSELGKVTTEDRLHLAGGESISGLLVSAPLDGPFLPADAPPPPVFRILPRGATEPLAIPAGKVIALSLAGPDLAAKIGSGAWLGLADGSLIQAVKFVIRAGGVSVQLLAGGELKTTLVGRDNPDRTFWDEVTLVQPVSPRVGWLSDLPPLGYRHIPYLSVAWPYAADASTSGGRLRAGGRAYRKGLGMHTTSRLAYDVAGYRTFAAELAIDEAAGDGGSAIFKVLLEIAPSEWTVAYESAILRGGDEPVPISIDLRGARRMALIVEFADRGDELDHANWLDARLEK